MGVAGQVLDVLQRHILAQQVRDHQDPERVRREDLRQPGGLEPALEHSLDGVRGQGPVGESSPAPLAGAKQTRVLGSFAESGPFDVGRDPLVQVETHRDLPDLAPLLGKLQRPVVAVVPQVPDPDPADGPDAGAGVNERPQDRPVAKSDDVARIDGGEQGPGLADGDLGGPALAVRVPDPPDRLEGIEQDRMPGDERVEEMPQSGQGLVLGGGAPRQLVQEPAGQTGGDLVELQALVLAPGQKRPDGPGVGGPGVGVGDPRPEELVRGEAGGLARTDENRREGPFEVTGRPRIRCGRPGEVRTTHHGVASYPLGPDALPGGSVEAVLVRDSGKG